MVPVNFGLSYSIAHFNIKVLFCFQGTASKPLFYKPWSVLDFKITSHIDIRSKLDFFFASGAYMDGEYMQFGANTCAPSNFAPLQDRIFVKIKGGRK